MLRTSKAAAIENFVEGFIQLFMKELKDKNGRQIFKDSQIKFQPYYGKIGLETTTWVSPIYKIIHEREYAILCLCWKWQRSTNDVEVVDDSEAFYLKLNMPASNPELKR